MSYLSEIFYSESEIPVHITEHRADKEPVEIRRPIRKTIKRSNLKLQSAVLPVVMNINPRSIYNKCDEFSLLLEQYAAEVICVSESFERDNLPLDKLLKLEDYEIISMVKRRQFKGGNPAILIKKEKFTIKRICPDPVCVPDGVEAIWALISPRNNQNKRFNYIAVCSLYYRGPKSTKRQ